MRVQDFAAIAAPAFEISTFFETGTNQAKTTRAIAALDQFESVFSVELSLQLYERAKALDFPGREKVEFLFGDSAFELPRMAGSLACPVFWLLDAHFCNITGLESRESFPLWHELRAIRQRALSSGWQDIVWIDDTHTFGRVRNDLGQPWEGVTAGTILDLMGDSVDRAEHIGRGFVLYLQ